MRFSSSESRVPSKVIDLVLIVGTIFNFSNSTFRMVRRVKDSLVHTHKLLKHSDCARRGTWKELGTCADLRRPLAKMQRCEDAAAYGSPLAMSKNFQLREQATTTKATATPESLRPPLRSCA
ncbi:unnamed protein product [Polarella glacialis]|uniref:Uncharacterized protein n=1 Tax=Polarella glacialis TaxID=89957 RepID=A0A813DGI9_POLGL|nr:unnamed protein product [Polarella glacialis]